MIGVFLCSVGAMAAGDALSSVFPEEGGLVWQRTTHPFRGGDRVVGRATLDGRPVYGLFRAATLGRDGAPRSIWGDLPSPRRPQRFEAQISAQDLGDDLRARLGAQSEPRAHEGFLLHEGEIVSVYVFDWIVSGWLTEGPATVRMWADARSGLVLRADKTSREAKGEIYEINPVLSLPEQVELPSLLSDASLTGTHVLTTSCDEWVVSESLFGLTRCLSQSTHALADAQGDFLFPQEPDSFDDPAAEVHVYYHVDKMSVWLQDRFGLSLPYAPIKAVTNFAWANAMFGDFDGDGAPDVSFGQDEETGIDLAYDAEVVYHELGHAVVGQLAPGLPFMTGDEYGLQWAPGAINEGAADIFSMLLSPDPNLAEYGGQAFGEPSIRDLAAPRRCPDDLLGEVHADGEILGSLGWRLISDPLVGQEVVADWLYGAIPLWGGEVDWPLVGRSLVQSADDLLSAGVIDGAAHGVIVGALAEWNLEGCERFSAVTPDREQRRLLITGGLQGDLVRLPAGTQMAIDVPSDATSLKITVTSFEGIDGMGYALYGRSGQPVGHAWTVIEAIGLGFSIPEESDWQKLGMSGPALVELEPDGEIPLIPGQTLYLSVASDNLGTLVPYSFGFGEIALKTELLTEQPPEGERKEGCGCATPPSRASWGLPLTLLWSLVIRRHPFARG